MDIQMEKLEKLIQNFERMTSVAVLLIKLKILKLFSQVVSRVLAKLVLIIIFLLSLLCLTIGVAMMLGELLGKLYLGFLCVCGFYLIIGIILAFKSKPWLENPIGNMIVRKVTKEAEL